MPSVHVVKQLAEGFGRHETVLHFSWFDCDSDGSVLICPFTFLFQKCFESEAMAIITAVEFFKRIF